MRAEWFTETTRPFSRARAIIRSQSATVSAMGFSTSAGDRASLTALAAS